MQDRNLILSLIGY